MPQTLDILDNDPFFVSSQPNAYPSTSCTLETPTLTIVDQWTLSVVPFSTSPPSGHRRRPRIFAQSMGIGTVSVKATQPILTGRNRWSQVWLGGIKSLHMTEASVVAIKVFQESMFPQDDDGPLNNGAQQAKTEASSYKLMSALQGERNLSGAFFHYKRSGYQGREVPWSYGFYKVLQSPLTGFLQPPDVC